jgi:hypothetical protein
MIQKNISCLISVFRGYQTTGEVVPIKHAFSALTSDTVSEYFFGGSENYIEGPGFNAMVNEVMGTLVDLTHITVQA